MTEEPNEKQRAAAEKIGDALDVAVADFVRQVTGYPDPLLSPMMRAQGAIAVATMLLRRASRDVKSETLDQIIDVLGSGVILEGGRAARRRAEKQILRMSDN